MLFSFKNIIQTNGWTGLFKGADASMLRTGIGSSVQLPSYTYFKTSMIQAGWFNGEENSSVLHFAASFCSGVVLVTMMNPFDVASTRMV